MLLCRTALGLGNLYGKDYPAGIEGSPQLN